MAETILGMTALNRRLDAVANVKRTGLLQKLATAAVAEQKALAPKKTTNLRRSIHVGTVSGETAQTVASANYARYVEYGTGPHEITPNARKALRWAGPGGARLTGTPTKAAQRSGNVRFAKRVHHPGTRAHPYMLPGARAAVAKSPLRDAIVIAWNDAA